jgi:ATP-dependent DNA helicase PIF1
MTLHTGVGLDFSNKHNSLSDKKRELKRVQYKNLKFLIVDECSMMKSDQLYQLDLRLRELKQNNRVFGGIAIFLLGDPAQLKPVKGRFAFDKPICEDYHLVYGDGSDSLWRSFQVINLTENHRQGNDKTYADILNRIRVGEQNSEDMELLKTRIRPKNHPDLKDSLYIACKKAAVNEHNEKCLNKVSGRLYEIKAKHRTKLQQNFKPYIQKDGTISDTQFLDVLKLKVGAKVMLIYNVDVSDLLCNGAMGTLIGVEVSSDGRVDKLIVKFANPKAGKESRKKHPNYSQKYPEGTVITKMEREYTLSKKASAVVASTAKLIQYPLILAFAVTVHKVQGQTIERPLKCVIDLRSVFEGAQAYVMLSRIKELKQLYILEELPENKIYPIQKALEEIRRLQQVSINNNPTLWDTESNPNLIKVC